MCNTSAPQVENHFFQIAGEQIEGDISVQILGDELVERQSLDPFHLQNGIPLFANPDTLLDIFNWNSTGQIIRKHVPGDCLIANSLIWHVMQETTYGDFAS